MLVWQGRAGDHRPRGCAVHPPWAPRAVRLPPGRSASCPAQCPAAAPQRAPPPPRTHPGWRSTSASAGRACGCRRPARSRLPPCSHAIPWLLLRPDCERDRRGKVIRLRSVPRLARRRFCVQTVTTADLARHSSPRRCARVRRFARRAVTAEDWNASRIDFMEHIALLSPRLAWVAPHLPTGGPNCEASSGSAA